MDKFGIFKLLNSFFNFYEQNKTSDGAHKNDSENSIGKLFSVFQPTASPTPPKNARSSAEKRASLPPLQASMLDVMSSHDRFINRVRKNNRPVK